MHRHSIEDTARRLGIHRNTVMNRIRRGQLDVERVSENGRTRTFVLLEELPEDPAPVPNGHVDQELVAAIERIRGLEELVDQLRSTVDFERERYAALLNDIKTGALALPAPKSRSWWRLWS